MKIICKSLNGLISGILIVLGLMNSQIILAQQINITGKVTLDLTKESLVGVSILEKGTVNGTLTDPNGNYSIKVNNANSILVFSFVGMVSQEVVVGGQKVIDVAMKENVSLLEEVVVTGYQVQRKVDLTGSVSALDVNEIKDNPSGSPLKSIQGKIPGVFITTSGSPNGNIDAIHIRGLNTLGSTNPLYVIDGIPTADYSVFSNLDPNSIASIQVLKDASSATIYGSRASNGVIIVTTREGKEKTSIKFSSSITTQSYLRSLSMCNTEQLGRALWQASINDGTDPGIHSALYTYDWHTDNGIAILDKVKPVDWIGGSESFGVKSGDTDWQKEVFRTGLISSNSISLNSGSEFSNLLVDLTYYSNKGLVINNDFKRVNGRVNSSTQLSNGKIKIGENILIGSNSEVPVPTDLGGESIINLATVIQPILPVYKTDGTFAGPIGAGFSDRDNPLLMSDINKDDRTSNLQIFGNVFLEITPIKNFVFRSNMGIDYHSLHTKDIERAFVDGFLSRSVNSLSLAQTDLFNWTWSNTMNYQLKLKSHSVSFLLGMEAIKQTTNYMSAKREVFAFEDVDYYYMNSGTGTISNSGYGTGNQLLSYFGKINYNFKEKYLLSTTLRYDGSSRFGTNNTFGLFSSASAGWVLSKESFISDALPFVSLLKLRAGIGKVGNQAIEDNARFALYAANYGTSGGLTSIGSAYDLNGVGTGTLPSGYVAIQTGNPNLKWESTNEINTGVDFGFLSQKITGSLDYFFRKTEDILIKPSYAGVVGEGGTQWQNGATVKNRGWEVALGYIGSISKEWDFNITGSVSHFADEITYLPSSVVKTYPGNSEKTILGHSQTAYFGYVTDGIFQNQAEVDSHANQPGKGIGRIRYKDLNEDGNIDPLDQDWLGNAIPSFEYGLNIEVIHKGFVLTVFMHGVQGITVADGPTAGSISTGGSITKTDFMGTILGVNKGTRLLDAWTPQNTSSTIPMMSLQNANSETRVSDYFLKNGSYFKIASMQFSYDLPSRINQMIKLKKSRIYLLAENFLLIKDTKGKNAYTGPDPETPGFIYPQPVRLTVGFDVTF